MLPIKGKFNITAIFGQTGKYWANGHKGIDFVTKNKEVYSTCDGVVRVVGFDEKGWGRYISIGEGEKRHLYCHLASANVIEGAKVKVGQLIGTMGSTGNSTGIHLHYQVNNASGTALNAADYLSIPNKQGEYNSDDFILFKDDADIPSWARTAVYDAKERGIMLGDTDGNFRPNAPLTRAEAAVLISKISK